MAAPSTYESIQIVPLTTKFNYRRGSYYQDAYVKNGFLEKEEDGPYAVKRPGLRVLIDFTTQTGYFPPLGTPLTSYGFQGGFTITEGTIAFIIAGRLLTISEIYGSSSPLNEFPVGPIPLTTLVRGAFNNGHSYWQGANAIYSGSPAGTIASPSSALLVPSLCELDRTFYIMDVAGVIWASAIADATTWPALNTVIAFPVGDAVVLFRHLQYLLAFSTYGLKVYYDAGISPGAPIAQEQSFVSSVGVPWAGSQTVQHLNDVTYWMGSSTEDGYGVYQIAGLQITKISTPEVNRYLTDNFTAYIELFGRTTPGTSLGGLRAVTVQTGGHSFYILICPSFNFGGYVAGSTLAYDITEQIWYLWSQLSSGLEAELRIAANLGNAGTGPNFLPDPSNGKVYTLDASYYQDAGQAITFEVQTALLNWGNSRTKIIAATYVSSDTLSSTYQLSWTDNDYGSFSVPQVMSSANSKKQLVRCGSTIERAWRLTHTDNTPMRFFNLEVEVLPGAL